MSRKEKFSLANIKLLDHGRIPAAFDMEIQRVLEDLKDRPDLEKARSVTMQFDLYPLMTDSKSNGGILELDQVEMQVQIKTNIPKRATRVHTMNYHPANGELSFHPDSPDDPDDDRLFDKQAKVEDDKK